jgi:hypothetical protein
MLVVASQGRSLGSAPTAEAAHRGIEDRRVKVGCVMPGESPAVFGDALRRLSAAATYLYQDGTRYSACDISIRFDVLRSFRETPAGNNNHGYSEYDKCEAGPICEDFNYEAQPAAAPPEAQCI